MHSMHRTVPRAARWQAPIPQPQAQAQAQAQAQRKQRTQADGECEGTAWLRGCALYGVNPPLYNSLLYEHKRAQRSARQNHDSSSCKAGEWEGDVVGLHVHVAIAAGHLTQAMGLTLRELALIPQALPSQRNTSHHTRTTAHHETEEEAGNWLLRSRGQIVHS